MPDSRLTLALEGGAISLPDTAGRIAVFGPRVGADLSALEKDRCLVVTGFKPDYDHFSGLGYECAVSADEAYDASIICVPRAKHLARSMVAHATKVTKGPVVVDGNKTDGVESLLKEIRKRVPVTAPYSKSHGKIFMFDSRPVFQDWEARELVIEGGFHTAPGVFSADSPDPGSEILMASLPAKLGSHIADLGSGWGYLARAILTRDTVKQLDLVEADHSALECAQQNIIDDRAVFHWADATTWKTVNLLDTVVMNPPFHTDRSANLDLGRSFVRAAGRVLKPSGQLWMVANRHLPYEPTLAECFGQTEEVAGDSKFKILRAARPIRIRG